MIKRTDLAETRKLPMLPLHMAVSLNGGTPKSSMLVFGFSITPSYWGTSIYGNPHMVV